MTTSKSSSSSGMACSGNSSGRQKLSQWMGTTCLAPTAFTVSFQNCSR